MLAIRCSCLLSVALLTLSIFQGPAIAEEQLGTKTFDRSPSSAFYEPIILFGNPNAVRAVVFYWSAVSPTSFKEFRRRIVPIAQKQKKAAVHIIVFQLLDKDRHDSVGPGAHLFCADEYKSYTSLATRYLASDPKIDLMKIDKSTGMYANSFIKKMISENKIKPEKCRSPNFFTRQVLSVAESKAIRDRIGAASLPVYVSNGITYLPTDPRVDDLLAGR